MEIGYRIREIRERAGLNQAEFAKAIRVSPAYVSYIEKGTKNGKPLNVSDQFIVSVAYRFGVNPRWIQTGDGKMRATSRELLISRTWMLSDGEVQSLLNTLRDVEAGKHCCVSAACGKKCGCQAAALSVVPDKRLSSSTS